MPTLNNHMTTDTSNFHVANIGEQYWKYKNYAVPPRKAQAVDGKPKSDLYSFPEACSYAIKASANSKTH